jgi:riboflavin kinase
VAVANLPDESLDPMTSVAKPGIYFGYAKVHFSDKSPESDKKVWPMVMSMGWNPYYKNEKLTAVSNIFQGMTEYLWCFRRCISCTTTKMISMVQR